MRVITIGRSSGNDIVIQDPKVSRTHLQLVSNGSICSVVDLNSANGTYVNGEKISGEVHLTPNDTIRIGDTNLPWQTYINNSIEPTGGSSENIPNTHPRDNKKIWIIITISALVILGGVGFGIYHYQNQKEKERIGDEYKKEQTRLEEEAKQKEEKWKKEEEGQEEYKNALRKDRDDNKKLAEEKTIEAENAKVAEKRAKEDANNAKAAAKKAQEDASSAKQKASEADKAKKEAETEASKAKEVERKAKEAAQTARKEASVAKKSEELTAQFYEEYLEMNESFAKQVCNEIKKNIPNNTRDVKAFLKNTFTKSDITGKQKIINAIKKLKS